MLVKCEQNITKFIKNIKFFAEINWNFGNFIPEFRTLALVEVRYKLFPPLKKISIWETHIRIASIVQIPSQHTNQAYSVLYLHTVRVRR